MVSLCISRQEVAYYGRPLGKYLKCGSWMENCFWNFGKTGCIFKNPLRQIGRTHGMLKISCATAGPTQCYIWMIIPYRKKLSL
jgi:hypothetical protein